MKTLILFSTRDGQTREIASYLASELKELGIYSDVVNLNRTEQIAPGRITTAWSLALQFVTAISIRRWIAL